MISAAIGLGLGFVLGAGLFTAKRRVPRFARLVGWLGPALLVLIGLIVGLTCLVALGRGSEGVTAGIVGLLFLALGVLATALAVLVPALIQAPRLQTSLPTTSSALLLEPLLLGAAVWVFGAQVTAPLQRQVTEDWWRRESARRQRVESLSRAIPERYRETTPEVLNMDAWNRQQVEIRGGTVPPMVPADTERSLRSYWAAQSEPVPELDRRAYAEAAEMRTHFALGAVAGWFAGAVLIPLAVQPRRRVGA